MDVLVKYTQTDAEVSGTLVKSTIHNVYRIDYHERVKVPTLWGYSYDVYTLIHKDMLNILLNVGTCSTYDDLLITLPHSLKSTLENLW